MTAVSDSSLNCTSTSICRFFEGKSQYVLTYIILMIPTASFAFECILNGKYTKIKEFVGKLKEIPDGKESEKA